MIQVIQVRRWRGFSEAQRTQSPDTFDVCNNVKDHNPPDTRHRGGVFEAVALGLVSQSVLEFKLRWTRRDVKFQKLTN